jgi:hypothetical protein
VIVTEVTSDPVYGAAFDIVFDPSVIAWAGNGVSSCGAGSPGCRTGDFLEATSLNGLLYNVARQEGTTNVVVVGITQTGSDPGVTGSGTLVTLMFRRVAGGTSDLTFSNNALRSAPLLSQITGMTWIGGTVTLP